MKADFIVSRTSKPEGIQQVYPQIPAKSVAKTLCRRFRLVVASVREDNAETMDRSDSTRATLLLRLRDRTDSLSWNEFHERYGQLLYRYARQRGASPVDAEDIVQDVALSLLKALDGFEYDAGKGRFRAYLRVAVIRAMARRANKAARQGEVVDPHNFDYLSAIDEANSDEHWEKEWRAHRLRWALRAVADSFEPVTLDAFRMHVLAGKSVKETAGALGISEASVYQAKSRVLKQVKQRLDELDPDEDV
ncbi:MAG: sigma-70 family RNA polymerase sigma factor [Phycisphaerales bacterium]|nr:sigma-70 family RNA polymerase sigma factor [Phycisphaerales bacterium]